MKNNNNTLEKYIAELIKKNEILIDYIKNISITINKIADITEEIEINTRKNDLIV